MPVVGTPILKSILGRRIGFSTRTPSTASNLIVEGGIVASNLSGTPVTLFSTATGVTVPTAQPASPVAGSMWWDTVGHILHIYDGAAWRASAAFT